MLRQAIRCTYLYSYMKNLVAIACLLLYWHTSYAQPLTLVWEDDFNTGKLDLSKWSYETGTGINGDWGTGQLDRSTDRADNVSFQNYIPGADNGCLAITTRKEFYLDRNYTSGRIRTAGKASWGPGHRIVAKVYPRDVKYKGQGFAFWMMPDEIPAGWTYLMWPQGGEIDIMEYVGSVPYHNLGTVHYAWYWQNNQWVDWNHGMQGFYYSYETKQVPSPTEPGYGGYPPSPTNQYAGSYGFHTYGIDWYPNRIEFFIDNNVYHIHYLADGGAFAADGQDRKEVQLQENRRVGVSEYSNHFSEWHPFEHKMYIILSAGVGGKDYTYGGPIVPEAVFPCTVFIDWVKVYQMEGVNGINSTSGGFGLKLFPNPTQQELYVQPAMAGEYALRVSDLSGKTMIDTHFRDSMQIDISHLTSGSYLVWVSNGHFSESQKVIVK